MNKLGLTVEVKMKTPCKLGHNYALSVLGVLQYDDTPTCLSAFEMGMKVYNGIFGCCFAF